MSDQPAVSPVLPPQPQGEGWSRNKFISLIALALALHVALIFIFGTKEQIVPREAINGTATNVPHLRLVANTDQFIALGDPTLFARPNAHDLVTAFWRRTQPVTQPNFNWTEDPRYLPPTPENFGAAFRRFMQASQLTGFPLDLKPEPKLTEPVIAIDQAMPQATTMELTGELAGRRMLTQVKPPSIAENNVIAPSRVQVLVDSAGNVWSAVLLPLDSALEEAGRSEKGDSNALAIARSLRFAPAPRLTFGEITFRWHTVPMTSTNAP